MGFFRRPLFKTFRADFQLAYFGRIWRRGILCRSLRDSQDMSRCAPPACLISLPGNLGPLPRHLNRALLARVVDHKRLHTKGSVNGPFRRASPRRVGRSPRTSGPRKKKGGRRPPSALAAPVCQTPTALFERERNGSRPSVSGTTPGTVDVVRVHPTSSRCAGGRVS